MQIHKTPICTKIRENMRAPTRPPREQEFNNIKIHKDYSVCVCVYNNFKIHPVSKIDNFINQKEESNLFMDKDQ